MRGHGLREESLQLKSMVSGIKTGLIRRGHTRIEPGHAEPADGEEGVEDE